ncbi:CoA transferase [uncultured Desulfovibrio sp.]|uniref:CaiB/BaiF CoA transferase family protein n=1 Tax=uncultured Desulfovibrio sp. TaxID=167968 RepID=UPI002803FF06|nr:CoA transferase [uncultured Desulfovibrio sp.]
MKHKPLHGVKVLELATYAAAPAALRALADWGAEVWKVESPQGDPYRRQAPVFNIPLLEDENLSFDMTSLNKRFIALDLKHPRGMEVFHRLLADADVFVTSFRQKALERLGLDYETLSARYPRLIMAQMFGYGDKGPEKDSPGYDVTCYVARGGILGSFHERGTSPINEPNAFGDYQAAMTLASGICAALYAREKTGRGDRVTTSLFHQALWAMSVPIMSAQYGNRYPKSRMEVANPFNNTYRTSDDRWLIICVPDYDVYFRKMMALFGREDLYDDEDVNSIGNILARNTHAKAIAAIGEAMSRRPLAEWLRIFKENDVPCEKGALPFEVLEDPQAWAIDGLRKVRYPSGNERVITTTPVRFASMGNPEAVIARPLGADTEAILAEHGFRREEIEELFAEGAAFRQDGAK